MTEKSMTEKSMKEPDGENFVTGIVPGAIEAQEKRGQTKLVNSSQLPKEIIDSTIEDFKKLGFVFGKDVDEIFVEARLPDGWQRKATDHSMWSEIVDEKGIKRVGVFYKAAFYDRKAHMYLVEINKEKK